MLSEEEGINAIIKLQAMAGIVESEEKAKIGWNNMADWEKNQTEQAYDQFFVSFPVGSKVL